MSIDQIEQRIDPPVTPEPEVVPYDQWAAEHPDQALQIDIDYMADDCNATEVADSLIEAVTLLRVHAQEGNEKIDAAVARLSKVAYSIVANRDAKQENPPAVPVTLTEWAKRIARKLNLPRERWADCCMKHNIERDATGRIGVEDYIAMFRFAQGEWIARCAHLPQVAIDELAVQVEERNRYEAWKAGQNQ